ncbi:hypothetical protein L4C31_21170, partial [Aliivibrio sifiae]
MKFEEKSEDKLLLVDADKVLETIKKDRDGIWLREDGRGKLQDFFSIIGGVKLSELPSQIHLSDFVYDINSEYGYDGASIVRDREQIKLSIYFTYELMNWNNPYSIKEYLNLLEEQLAASGASFDYAESSSTLIDFTVFYSFKECDLSLTIRELLTHECSVIQRVRDNVSKKLASSVEGMFSKVFNFPKHYQIVCIQYLMWFGEVLENVGITADLEAKNSGSGTVLSINYEGGEALTQEIEKLFYQYLSLPYAEFLPKESSDESLLKFQLLNNQVEQFKFNIQQIRSSFEIEKIKNRQLVNELNQVN